MTTKEERRDAMAQSLTTRGLRAMNPRHDFWRTPRRWRQFGGTGDERIVRSGYCDDERQKWGQKSTHVQLCQST